MSGGNFFDNNCLACYTKNMHKARVSLKERSYDIVVTSSPVSALAPFLKRLGVGPDAVVVTNPTIASLHGASLKRALKKAGCSAHFEFIPDTEKSKSIKAVSSLIDRIASYDKSKGIFIIAFGGGVVGDTAGFAASIYKRGVPYVQVPTTLLAQVDSSIGGKTGADLPVAKNLVGSIYQPRLVFSSVQLLDTLPEREFRNGLAEVIKYGAICDKGFLDYLKKNRARILRREKGILEHVVYKCASIKACYVSADERELKGIRTELNFGHTIGHALEAACGYSKSLSHGEAISIGMSAAAGISCRLGLLKEEEAGELKNLLLSFRLPVRLEPASSARLTPEAGSYAGPIMRAYMHDKKFLNGTNRMVLLKGIGKAIVRQGIPEGIIRRAVIEATGDNSK